MGGLSVRTTELAAEVGARQARRAREVLNTQGLEVPASARSLARRRCRAGGANSTRDILAADAGDRFLSLFPAPGPGYRRRELTVRRRALAAVVLVVAANP